MRTRLRLPWCIVLLFVGASGMQAQPRTAGEWAWRPLFVHEEVVFSYLFYTQAQGDGQAGNGVVLKLMNRNDHAVDYRFKVIFRSEGEERVEEVAGTLQPGEVKTGSSAGLFWIPFPEGRTISEVGVRGYRVTPRAAPSSSSAATTTAGSRTSWMPPPTRPARRTTPAARRP